MMKPVLLDGLKQKTIIATASRKPRDRWVSRNAEVRLLPRISLKMSAPTFTGFIIGEGEIRQRNLMKHAASSPHGISNY
jgi:hypothetical protein